MLSRTSGMALARNSWASGSSTNGRPVDVADAVTPAAADAIRPTAQPAAPAAVAVPTAAELKEFEAWRDLQRIDQHEAIPPSLDKIFATGLVAAAATPAVLLLPTWAPLLFVQSAFAYFNGAVDDWPFWTLRASIALVAHPAITLTCATSCALAFSSQRSVLNSVGWVENSSALVDEASRVGRNVGLTSALISPVAVLAVHQGLTFGWLDGLMPRALALDYWVRCRLSTPDLWLMPRRVSLPLAAHPEVRGSAPVPAGLGRRLRNLLVCLCAVLGLADGGIGNRRACCWRVRQPTAPTK